MVAIIGLVVCQEEEFIFLYKDHIHPDVLRGALVGMVCMVAIARYFGVVRALNQQKTKVVSRRKVLLSRVGF